MNTTFWGELPIIQDTESGIAAIELEQMTKPRSLEIEGPNLYNSKLPYLERSKFDKDYLSSDPRIIENIKLVKYIEDINFTLNTLSTQKQLGGDAEFSAAQVAKPPPMTTNLNDFVRKSFLNVERKFNLKEDKLVEGEKPSDGLITSLPGLDLSNESLRLLLKKTVVVICAHSGITKCSESVINVLTDVCHSFLVNVTKKLRSIFDIPGFDPCESYDPLQHVLTELGLCNSCPSDLLQFYKENVLLYGFHLKKRTIKLYNEVMNFQNELNSKTSLSSSNLSATVPGDQLMNEQIDGNQLLSDSNKVELTESLVNDTNLNEREIRSSESNQSANCGDLMTSLDHQSLPINSNQISNQQLARRQPPEELIELNDPLHENVDASLTKKRPLFSNLSPNYAPSPSKKLKQ